MLIIKLTAIKKKKCQKVLQKEHNTHCSSLVRMQLQCSPLLWSAWHLLLLQRLADLQRAQQKE